MSTQNILWTALPSGLNAAGDRLLLSVLVSPRLITDGGVDGTLAQFPDFLDWPATIAGMTFHVEFQGGPSFDLRPVVQPGFPALDSEAWKALFQSGSTVHSYAFDDRAGIPVRSFPTKKLLSFIKSEYQTIAVESAASKPTLAQLGLGPNSPRQGLAGVALNSDLEAGVRIQIEGELKRASYVSRDFGSARHDFYQVKLMHEFLSKNVRNPDGSLQPLPPQSPPDVDFHKAVSAMGQYPKLMRALGRHRPRNPRHVRRRALKRARAPQPARPCATNALDRLPVRRRKEEVLCSLRSWFRPLRRHAPAQRTQRLRCRGS